jgi:hypothetical protein
MHIMVLIVLQANFGSIQKIFGLRANLSGNTGSSLPAMIISVHQWLGQHIRKICGGHR